MNNLSWSKQLVNLLYQKGVRHACISPGSRNAPITYQLIQESKIKCFSHIDERSSCYFGLGIAKQTKKPVVILTTSGTAIANLFPAIIESYMSMIPLIIITADRPKYLLNTGENQTIQQANIYREFVKEAIDINHKKSTASFKKIDKALNKLKIYSQPIHINIRFEEPLIDDEQKLKYYKVIKYKKTIKKSSITFPLFKRPLIVCGGSSHNKPSEILRLAQKIKAPIFADILSNLRYQKSNNINVYYDHYLDNINFKPDFILRFGRKPVSKKLCQFISRNKTKSFLLEPYANFNDDCPNLIKTTLKNVILKFSSLNTTDSNWIKHIKNLELISKKFIEKNIQKNKSESWLIHSVANRIQKNDCLFISNSTPIRTFDKFSGHFKNKINVLANRGASGIDGITSTALGMAIVNNASNNFLITGDISIFHDSNAFHIINSTKINLTIIVINNKGGQIFSQLDYSKKNLKGFSKYWVTPPFTRIKDLATLYQLKYYKYNIQEINKNLNKTSSMKGIKIIEVLIDASKDIDFKSKIEAQINNLV